MSGSERGESVRGSQLYENDTLDAQLQLRWLHNKPTYVAGHTNRFNYLVGLKIPKK